jgi:hypothetical protein
MRAADPTNTATTTSDVMPIKKGIRLVLSNMSVLMFKKYSGADLSDKQRDEQEITTFRSSSFVVSMRWIN